MSVHVFAQSPQQQLPGEGSWPLLPTSRALQHALVDSLNTMAAKRPGLSVPLPATAAQLPSLQSFRQLNDSARRQFYNYLRQSYGKQQLEQFSSGWSVIKDTGRLRSYVDQKLRGFYALRNEGMALPLLKAGAFDNKFKGGTVTAFADNTPGNIGSTGFNVNVADELIVGNIPFQFNYVNVSGNSVMEHNFMGQGLMKASFDKEAYKERLTGYVNKTYDLKKYFLADMDMGSVLKSYTGRQLADIGRQLENYLPADKAGALQQLCSPEELLYLDTAQLKNLLLQDKTLQLKEADLAGCFNSDTIGSTGDTSAMRQAVRSYLSRIGRLKSELTNDLAARRMIGSQQQVQGRLQQQLTANGLQQAKELLPLNFVQRLFLHAKDFNIGNIAANGSRGGVEDLFMTGVQGSFLVNNKFLMAGIGQRRDGGYLKDMGFTGSVAPATYGMQFLQVGKGDIDQAHSHVSMVNARSKSGQSRGFNAQQLSRNIFVGAFSEQVSLGEYGSIAAHLSKSNNEFNNSAAGKDAALTSKTAAFTLFNDFWSTLSVGLDYKGQVDAFQLKHRVYISYAGLGYSNPASPGASRGTIRYGIDIKRSWYKNRVQAGFRADMQDIRASSVSGSKWKNSRFAFDTRIRLKKHFSLSAHLAQTQMKGIFDKSSGTGYLSRQLSLTSQVGGRLFSMPQNSHITLGLQQMDVMPLRSLLLSFNVNQSLVISKNILSVSIFYNRDIKDNALYGNLFTAESGCTYQLWKQVTCSSGFTYLDNKNIVRQIGVKQTLGAMLLRKLNMNLYVDCRTHLLNTPQNYLFGNFRSEMSFNYLLN